MRNNRYLKFFLVVLLFAGLLALFAAPHVLAETPQPSIQVSEQELGFKIPTLSQILTFAIRGFFVIGGLVAFVMALLGIIGWITSRGEKEAVGKAQQTIQAAFLGVILIAIVLALVVTLEQVIFKGTICLGLSCPISIPGLVRPCDEVKGSNSPCSGPTLTPLPPRGGCIVYTPGQQNVACTAGSFCCDGASHQNEPCPQSLFCP